MTQEEKLAAVEERIRELVPRLKELSFGCEIDCYHSVWDDSSDQTVDLSGIYTVLKKFSHTDGNDSWETVYCFYDQEIPIEGIKEIIGHPIQLEDVLEWMDTIGKTFESFAVHELLNFWEYGKNLSEQSTELIDFLYNLFSN